jgi:hypothetical protein
MKVICQFCRPFFGRNHHAPAAAIGMPESLTLHVASLLPAARTAAPIGHSPLCPEPPLTSGWLAGCGPWRQNFRPRRPSKMRNALVLIILSFGRRLSPLPSPCQSPSGKLPADAAGDRRRAVAVVSLRALLFFPSSVRIGAAWQVDWLSLSRIGPRRSPPRFDGAHP